MNRVVAILSERDEEKRWSGIQKLFNDVYPAYGNHSLDGEETDAVLNFLRGHALSVWHRSWLWRLLIHGAHSPAVCDYALECLRQEDTYIRGLSFLYLQIHAAPLVPELTRRYENDPSPHVRYQIACTVSDPQQRRRLLKSIIPDVGYYHELGDSIELDLDELNRRTY